MKKSIVFFIMIIILYGCQRNIAYVQPQEIDFLSRASGIYEYEGSSYNLNKLIEKLNKNQHGNIAPAVSLSTVNEDQTPNVGIFIPKVVMVEETTYLIAWISQDTNTYKNIKAGREGVFLLHEYNNTIESPIGASQREKNQAKLERNKGCRVVVKYVGDKIQDELYKKASMPDVLKENNLFLEIIKIYPLG